MVTQIFGLLNLNGIALVSKKMADQAKYLVSHRWYETDVEEGRLGVIIIGDTKKELRKIPLQKFENLTVCADITFYNRQELEDRLKLPENLSDIEILGYAFRTWGHECVRYFTGDFAFAIWDSEKQELFCARDHIGMRPFFYAQINGGFVFASELRMVIAGFETLPPLNNSFLLDTLVTVISEKHETAFENIFRLPPAHRLFYSKGKVKIEKYHQFDTSKKISYKDEGEYIDCFRKLLVNAVEIRCEGALNIASELSGGLDSSLVTCVAADFASPRAIPFTAFSNTLPDNHGTAMIDEKEHIQKILGWKTFNWCEVNDIWDTIPEIIAHTIKAQACFTQQRFHMLNKGIYTAAGKSGADILLSGFGGDEMVSARTGNAWNDMLKEKQWRYFYQALKHDTWLPKAIIKGLKAIALYHLKRNSKPGKTSGVFTPQMLKKRLNNLPLLPEFMSDKHLKERYFSKHERIAALFLAERQLQKIDHQHVSQRLEYSYAAAAQYGLQYRYPLLDIRLLQTVLSFPSWMKNRPGMDRYLFRQAMKGLVPEEIRLRRDKTGAVIPHIYTRFQIDKRLLSDFFRKCSEDDYLKSIFDFSRFDGWMEALLERNPGEMNYLMPGAFYNYLMVIHWFKEYRSK